MLLALERYPKVFVKISHLVALQTGVSCRFAEQVKRLYHVFGPRRLMWGTDWPLVERHCGYAKALALVRDEMRFLSDDDKSWILKQNHRTGLAVLLSRPPCADAISFLEWA
jgi:L-fuconolactonase